MRVLLAGVAALLLLTANEAWAQPFVREVGLQGVANYDPPTVRLGEQVHAWVRFSSPVRVTGSPQIGLTIGSRTRWATYAPAPGIGWDKDRELRMWDSLGHLVQFLYTAQATDVDSDGISIAANALRLNGGTITRSGGTTAATLGHAAVPAERYRATVNGGLHVPPRSYRTTVGQIGGELLLYVFFEPPVTVTGTPRVKLLLGEGNYYDYYSWLLAPELRTGTFGGRLPPPSDAELERMTRYAAYDAARSRPDRLVFVYRIQAADFDNDGIIVPEGGGGGPLKLNDGIIVPEGSNPLELNGGTIVDAAHPTIHADLAKSNLNPYCTRSRCTTVDGSRSGTNPDGGGTNPGGGSNPEPRLRVSAVRFTGTPASGTTYRLGEQIEVAVTFTEAVTVTGTPQIGLTIGSQTRQAVYDTTQSKGTLLVFSYNVQATDTDADGISIAANALALNSGTINLASDTTTAAVLAHASVGTDDTRKVDGSRSGTTPDGGGNPGTGLRVSTVQLTGTPASGATYRLGEQIEVAVTFTEAVTVTGTPQLGLTIGSQTRQAVYDAAQSKGTLAVLSYYVQATDADADGISIAANALTLNGGTITLASDTTTAAALDHAGVGTDDTRKVDGSTDVVEHGDSREQATLLVLSARTTGEVGETGQENDVQVGVATARSAEVAGALEQTGDADYFRVEVPGAGRLTVETTGATDTVGALLGATGQVLTEDDDGGTGTNFRVEQSVQAGTYYVAVTGGESEQVVGLYTLAVGFTPARGGTTVGNVAPPPGGSTPPRGSTPPAGSAPPDRGATGDREDRQPTAIRLNTETTGRLDRAGEVDRFRVEIQEAGTVTVEASGAAAPIAYFGAGDEPSLPARASVRAVQAAWPVTAGTYHVAVVGGSGRTRTGAYTVAVHFTAASEAGPLRATLLNVAPAQAWVHFYCGRAQDSEAAACTAQVQCGQQDGVSVAWDVTVPAETSRSYWPGRRAADGTSTDFAAALVAAGTTEEDARQRTTCRVFSPDPLEVRAYTQVAGELVPVAHLPAPLDAAAPTRVATLLNVAPAHARVHLACRKTQTAEGEPVDPCVARLQCGQQDGAPVAWDVDVAAETTLTYGPGGAFDDLATALVAAGKTETDARRRTTCRVFSRDPLDAWAYTRVGGELVSVTNPPASVDAGAPTRVATLLNVAPAHAWVHFYCRKAHDPAAEPVDPCNVRLQCGQRDGAPVSWDVNVAPETIFAYWPDKTVADGTAADFAAALIGAGKAEAEAQRRTTCQVFSTDPVDVRGYTQVGGAVVPVANPPVVPAADAPPTRIGTLLNLAPAQAWVHFYCRKAHQPDAETVDPCTVQLQCGQRDGPSVGWDVDVAPETIFSYWPGRRAADGTPDNLAAALVAAGKPAAEARRRTTCQVFSADPVDVRGYTQLGGTVIPVKN